MSDRPVKKSYTSVIDLTTRAQEQRSVAKAREEYVAPDPPLEEASVDTLPERLKNAVRAAGWASLMPVQEKAIPYLLDGRDMIVQSRTGSGKTGAFLLPLFRTLDSNRRDTQALILTPTRELARQIYDEFMRIRGDDALEATVIYGGVKYGPQLAALDSGVHIVIGTPGRILDHLQQGNLKLDNLSQLVLDEADEMLSMGFYPDMRKLKGYLPAERQSCMFSATMPARVRNLANEFLNTPGFLSLSSGSVGVDLIEHRYYRVEAMQKDRVLVRLIEMENPESAIIFANTRREVEYVDQFLRNSGYDAASLSGDLSQAAREKVMARIRKGQLKFLVATDVAARGIDISDLSHVFMYDVPQDAEYYVHRSGRTARAGKTGKALILTTIDDYRNLLAIGQRYGIDMTNSDVPSDEDVTARVTERLTVELESRLRDRTNLERERLQRFMPLVEELSAEEPALLAMMLDELYHDLLHKRQDGPSSDRGRGGKGRRDGRRDRDQQNESNDS